MNTIYAKSSCATGNPSSHLVLAQDEVEGGGVLQKLDDDRRLGEGVSGLRDLGEADVPLVGEEDVGAARNWKGRNNRNLRVYVFPSTQNRPKFPIRNIIVPPNYHTDTVENPLSAIVQSQRNCVALSEFHCVSLDLDSNLALPGIVSEGVFH